MISGHRNLTLLYVFTDQCSDNESSIRLVNSSSNSSGRIEVCLNGTWGTVCDDGFGLAEGDVVCNQLGFTLGIISCDIIMKCHYYNYIV